MVAGQPVKERRVINVRHKPLDFRLQPSGMGCIRASIRFDSHNVLGDVHEHNPQCLCEATGQRIGGTLSERNILVICAPEKWPTFVHGVEQIQLETKHRLWSRAKVAVEFSNCPFQEMRRLDMVGT